MPASKVAARVHCRLGKWIQAWQHGLSAAKRRGTHWVLVLCWTTASHDPGQQHSRSFANTTKQGKRQVSGVRRPIGPAKNPHCYQAVLGSLDTQLFPTLSATSPIESATMLVSLTVGKVDAGVTVLLTPDKRLARLPLERPRGIPY